MPDNQANKANFIPVVDLFAGAGGLGEGFNAFQDGQAFRTILSIEQNEEACQTLKLRALFWKLKRERKSLSTEEYCESIQSQDNLDRLIERYEFTEDADKEVWHTTLDPNSSDEVIRRIREALGHKEDSPWVLVGGPPCQAFSLAGRSRMRYTEGSPESDLRPSLYKIYLDILRERPPTIFLMENVDSLLSAKLKIDDDAGVDGDATEKATSAQFVMPEIKADFKEKEYELHHVSHHDAEEKEDRRFVVESERHGIPQQRHRVIIMGIHKSPKDPAPQRLPLQKKVHTRAAIKNLPPLASMVSGSPNLDEDERRKKIESFCDEWWLKTPHLGSEDRSKDIEDRIENTKRELQKSHTGADVELPKDCFDEEEWSNPLDHTPRRHKEDDLRRYLFASFYAKLNNGTSPQLRNFPRELLPTWNRIRTDSPEEHWTPEKQPNRSKTESQTTTYKITFKDSSKGWPKWAIAAADGVHLFLTKLDEKDLVPRFMANADDTTSRGGWPVVSGKGRLRLSVKSSEDLPDPPPDRIELFRLDDKERNYVLTTRGECCAIKRLGDNVHQLIITDPSNHWPRWAAKTDTRLRLIYTSDPPGAVEVELEDERSLIFDVELDNDINPHKCNATLINLKNLSHFGDAFSVQPPDKPAYTITCHAGKDGHKSIHHEPWQCRSLTVREVARIQTFPDNYLFFGKPTKQFIQVGNAVPPKLAEQLAEIVFDALGR